MKTCWDNKTEKAHKTRLGWYLRNKTLPSIAHHVHIHVHVVTCAHVQVLVVLSVQSVMFHFYDNILLTYTVHVQVYDVNCAMILYMYMS